MATSNRNRKVEVRNGVLGYVKGENFIAESNFIITRILCCVKVGVETGYLVKVRGSGQQNETTCYFTLDEANNRKRFLRAINNNSDGTGYMCQLHDGALNRYLMNLVDEFKRQSNGNDVNKLAVTCHGLNEVEGSKIWVFNEKTQIDEFGNLLTEGTTRLIWLGQYVSRGIEVPVKYRSNIVTPLDGQGLRRAMNCLARCLGNNFIPAFMFIAGGVMMVHYRFCLETFQQCPTPIATGPKGTGKTTAAKVFLALTGHDETFLVRKITEVEASTHCAKSSVPFVYDDPDNLNEAKTLVNNTFNGQVRATNRGTSVPATGCMILANTSKLPHLLNNFQEASRVVMIPFPKLDKLNPLPEQLKYEKKLRRKLENASRAVGVLVSIAHKLTEDRELLASIVQQVELILGEEAHHRIKRNYSILMMFALKIAELFPSTAPSRDSLWDFLNREIKEFINAHQREEAHNVVDNEKEDVSATAVITNVAEVILSEATALGKATAREYFNPAVRSQGNIGQTHFAVAKRDGLALLEKAKVDTKMFMSCIKSEGLGELNAVREFYQQNRTNYKQRAITFKRALVPRHLRTMLDNALGYKPAVEESDDTHVHFDKEVSIVCSNSTHWLLRNGTVLAEGVREKNSFRANYSLNKMIKPGDEVECDTRDNISTCTFPAGTQITFAAFEHSSEENIDPEKSEGSEGCVDEGDEGSNYECSGNGDCDGDYDCDENGSDRQKGDDGSGGSEVRNAAESDESMGDEDSGDDAIGDDADSDAGDKNNGADEGNSDVDGSSGSEAMNSESDESMGDEGSGDDAIGDDADSDVGDRNNGADEDSSDDDGSSGSEAMNSESDESMGDEDSGDDAIGDDVDSEVGDRNNGADEGNSDDDGECSGGSGGKRETEDEHSDGDEGDEGEVGPRSKEKGDKKIGVCGDDQNQDRSGGCVTDGGHGKKPFIAKGHRVRNRETTQLLDSLFPKNLPPKRKRN